MTFISVGSILQVRFLERTTFLLRLLTYGYGEGDFVVTKFYVGNLPFSAREDEIKDVFAAHGNVVSVNLINDRETGRPRGFGFVEMDGVDTEAVIEQTNGQEIGGRTLKVSEARQRDSRPRRRFE